MQNLLSKADIKVIQSLHLKKYRQKYHKFVAEGSKILLEVIQKRPDLLHQAYLIPPIPPEINDMMVVFADRFTLISDDEMRKITHLATPTRALAVLHLPPAPVIAPAEVRSDWSLVLDGIQDPGNFGTIIRIAAWFGLRHIFCSSDCAHLYSPKVIQATMGNFLNVNVITTELPALFEEFADTPVFGAFMDGENAFKMQFPTAGFLAIGSEGQGIRAAVSCHVAHRIAVPPHSLQTESLNAAVAAGILCATIRNV